MLLARALSIEAARRAGAIVFGGLLLWQVVDKAGQGEGEVVVHVAEVGATVSIDGRDYAFDLAPGEPICQSLRPGRHALAMRRGGRIVYEESFTIEPGDHLVLTAWDEAGRPSTRPVPPGSAR